MPITKWTPEKVLKEVRSNLESNGEKVGIFCEVEARRRLHAITEPTWGRGYRTQIVSRLLTHKIKSSQKEVDILIGTEISSEYKSKEYRYYGYWIEVGTRRFPPHPWLRPAVFDNKREILALIEGR